MTLLATLPAFPAFLPLKVLRDSWSMVPDSPLRRTEMDDGAIAVERRFARVRTVVSVGWDFDGAGFELFRHWWLHDLDAGARWFQAPVFEGLGETTRSARFASNPPWQATSPVNGVLTVTFQLELLDLPVITAQERTVLEIARTDPQEVPAIAALMTEIVAKLGGTPQWH